MQERLLQYIWQHQYFNRTALHTCCGKAIFIHRAGYYNHHQGPDFLHASISIDGILWSGSIELHIRSSDWMRHGHDADHHYRNVILHVVWENDKNVSHHPVLELKGRVALSMLQRFELLMRTPASIPCSDLIHGVNDFVWTAWKTRLVAERLKGKADVIFENFRLCNQSWPELYWRMLAKYFSTPVNAEAMEAIAASITVKRLAKHKHHLLQLEALLMGQAGLLKGSFSDDYPKLLQGEYRFLKHKYQLSPASIPLQFLRMRPHMFPTIQLSMLAAFVHRSHHFISNIFSAVSVHEVKKMFEVQASEYWNTHFVFDRLSPFAIKKAGTHMQQNLMINVVIPLLYAHGLHYEQDIYKEKSIEWLLALPKEKNAVSRHWEELGVSHLNAFDSQALLHLKKHYCEERRCLQCAIGNAILNSAASTS